MSAEQLLNITEIFTSRQGEGPTAGERATFLRVHKCNLRCGFCDTERALSGPPKMVMTADETVGAVTASWASVYGQETGGKRAVITGGEPMRQIEPVRAVVAGLGEPWQVEIETNGTIKPEGFDGCQINCSPKLCNAGMPEDVRIKPEVLRGIARMPRAFFKFVITDQGCIGEIRKLVEMCGIDPKQVILMPEGTDKQVLLGRAAEVQQWAAENGWGYSQRLHIIGGFQ